MLTQTRSKKKPSGGRYKKTVITRKHSMARLPAFTKIDEKKVVAVKKTSKQKLLRTKEANVFNGKVYQKAEIKRVVENAANRHFVRRNIITKGAIIETSLGNAKVTSRPGQDGMINAILL